MKVGVHQGSVLSSLLFIIVLEALSREFRAGVPWEDLYADDLVIIADSLEECVRRLLIWKEAMEKKGLRVNAGKTNVMICGTGLDLLQSSGEYPCAVCRTGVGNNSMIYCNGCKLWVHKKCSGLQRLTPNPDYRCVRCMGNARHIDGRPQRYIILTYLRSGILLTKIGPSLSHQMSLRIFTRANQLWLSDALKAFVTSWYKHDSNQTLMMTTKMVNVDPVAEKDVNAAK